MTCTEYKRCPLENILLRIRLFCQMFGFTNKPQEKTLAAKLRFINRGRRNEIIHYDRTKRTSCTSFFLISLNINCFHLFIYLFLAALGLHCCTQTLTACSEWGLLFVEVHELLVVVASLIVEHRLQVPRLSCSIAYGIFQNQGSNPLVSCNGGWTLYQWITREVPHVLL